MNKFKIKKSNLKLKGNLKNKNLLKNEQESDDDEINKNLSVDNGRDSVRDSGSNHPTHPNNPSTPSNQTNQSTKNHIIKAIKEDLNVFKYDETYEKYQTKKQQKQSEEIINEKTGKKQPKYINNLLLAANIRKTEKQEILLKKQLKNDDFNNKNDTEMFITENYRIKQEEDQMILSMSLATSVNSNINNTNTIDTLTTDNNTNSTTDNNNTKTNNIKTSLKGGLNISNAKIKQTELEEKIKKEHEIKQKIAFEKREEIRKQKQQQQKEEEEITRQKTKQEKQEKIKQNQIIKQKSKLNPIPIKVKLEKITEQTISEARIRYFERINKTPQKI